MTKYIPKNKAYYYLSIVFLVATSILWIHFASSLLAKRIRLRPYRLVPHLVYRTENLSDKYPNIAIQDLYEQHDQLLLRARNFYDQLRMNSRLRTEYAQKEPMHLKMNAKPICLVIMASNRDTPYIDLLVYMLTQRQRYEEIYSLAEVHVMNMEQRASRQNMSYLKNLKMISFVQLYDFAKESIAPNESYGLSQRKAGRRSIEICKTRKAKWCIVMEDDALPPARFFPLFKQHVIKKLRGDEFAFVRLFNSFNDDVMNNNGHNIHDLKWVNSWYKKFRMNTRVTDLSRKTFVVKPTLITYGGVANAFHQSMYQVLLETYDSFGGLNKTTEMNDIIVGHYFPLKAIKRAGVFDPSLVGHIGLSSEHDKRSDFSRIFADVRFQTNLN